jgi:multidrug efflux pump subunit AcrA (membrane-fusion protein)
VIRRGYLVSYDAAEVESFRRVPYSRGPRRAAKALVVLFVLLAMALGFVPWQQTAYGEGEVVAYSPTDRPQSIEAPVGGRIEEWFVLEGTSVREGDPVARIVDIDPELLTRLRGGHHPRSVAGHPG